MTDVRAPGAMEGWDARCLNCSTVHVIWLQEGESTGDTVGHVHGRKPGACGKYADHRLLSSLDGIDHPEA